MSDFILGHSDQGFLASYTVGGSGWSFNSNLDQTMLNNQLITAIARTTDLNEMVLDITLAEPEYVDVVGIVKHNLTASGTYQWLAYSDLARTIVVYDSTQLTIDSYLKNLKTKTNCDLTGSEISTPYWRLIVNDAANPDGYFEFGRLFMGRRFYPNINMDYGLHFGLSDSTSEITQSESGVDQYLNHTSKREVSFSFEAVSNDLGDAFIDMGLGNGITAACLFKFDSAEHNQGLKTFLCRNQSLSPLDLASFDANKINISLIEVI